MQDTWAVVGSRTFDAIEVVRTRLAGLVASGRVREVVSGGARGADSLAAQVATELGVPCVVLAADWARYGRSAGPRRNAEIAARADALLAFIDRPLAECRGTHDVVDRFRKAGKPVEIVAHSTPDIGSAMPAVHEAIRHDAIAHDAVSHVDDD